jgi:hypothetical protein
MFHYAVNSMPCIEHEACSWKNCSDSEIASEMLKDVSMFMLILFQVIFSYAIFQTVSKK